MSEGKSIALRRAVAVPVLHAALKGPSPTARATPQHPTGLPHSVIWMVLAVATFCALVADTTDEIVPFAIAAILPVAALAFDMWSRRASRSIPPVAKREARIVADVRPVLLRKVLVLPQGRPTRIVAKLPRLLIQIPTQPVRKRGVAKRKARLLASRRGPGDTKLKNE